MMKYLLNAVAAVLCAACMVVMFCADLDDNPYDEKHKIHSHVRWDTTTAATCTAPGTRTSRCACEKVVETKDIAPLGHKWGEWVTTTPATCNAQGEKARICAHDATHVNSEKIERLNCAIMPTE